MDTFVIGLRAQDFHEALKLTGTFGPKDVYYKRTLLIGKAATLAMHLRGLLYIEDYSQLELVASALGISSLELPAVLRELEQVSFISVNQSGDEIKRVDFRIPTFRSGYVDLGERWKELKPTEIEQASLATLERLHQGPITQDTLTQKLGLPKPQFSILSDVMQSGQLLSVQPVDGERDEFVRLGLPLGLERLVHEMHRRTQRREVVADGLEYIDGRWVERASRKSTFSYRSSRS